METSADRPLALVVEDEAVVAMVLSAMLDDMGYEVITAAHVERAIGYAEQANIAVAILDVSVNGVESYPVAEALRGRHIPFMFATGFGKGGLREEWRDIPTLGKPFEEVELAAALPKLLAAAD